MARAKFNFKDLVAEKGKVESGSGGDNAGSKFVNVPDLKFDPLKSDDTKRLYIVTDEEGFPITYKQNFHSIHTSVKTPNGRGIVELPKKDGGTFAPFRIGCTHYIHEQDQEVKQQLKEDGQRCLFCEIANMEQGIVGKKVRELYPNFKDLTPQDKKKAYDDVREREDIYETLDKAWEISYDKDEGRNTFKEFGVALKILVAEISDEYEHGYELKFFNVSNSRLALLNEKLAEVIDLGVYDSHPELVKELGNTEDGEKLYNLGRIEFDVTYPKNKSKMESGRKATIKNVKPNESIAVSNKELEEAINKEVSEKIEAIDNAVENDYLLKYRTYEEQMEITDMEYVRELRRELGYSEDGVKPEYKDEGEDTKAKSSTKAKKETEAETETADSNEGDIGDIENLFEKAE